MQRNYVTPAMRDDGVESKGLQRVKVVENAIQGRVTVAEASRLLQLSRRQVKRLKARYEPGEVDLGAARQSRTAEALGAE